MSIYFDYSIIVVGPQQKTKLDWLPLSFSSPLTLSYKFPLSFPLAYTLSSAVSCVGRGLNRLAATTEQTLQLYPSPSILFIPPTPCFLSWHSGCNSTETICWCVCVYRIEQSHAQYHSRGRLCLTKCYNLEVADLFARVRFPLLLSLYIKLKLPFATVLFGKSYKLLNNKRGLC